MKHGSLFSGIGGFDLAAEWMGWENVFHCEWNEFGQRVLNNYWPDAELFTDITKSDFTKYHGSVDIISGGFPCQPYSQAGKRLGKADERHLWPHMLRAIREISPRWVVGENVRGLTNWNGGLVFDEVQADLEAAGYEVLPFLLPACAVNAPHRRDRVWFVAYSESNRNRRRLHEMEGKDGSKWKPEEYRQDNNESWNDGSEWDVNNTISIGRHPVGDENGNINKIKRQWKFSATNSTYNKWRNFPSQSPVCGGDDGIPRELDGITFSKWRNESIKAYGNAVVPQVVLQIFKAIQQYEEMTLR